VAGVQVKVPDKWNLNGVQVSALNPAERNPEGVVVIDILDAEGDFMAGVSLSPEGVRDLITALEYAELYRAGEV
jgi:hypothetical protein